MFDKKLLGQRLRTLRSEAKIPQRTLSTQLNIGKSAISMIESGQRATSLEVIYILADYFNVSLDYLVGRTDCNDILTYDKEGNTIIIEAMKSHQDE